MFRSAEHWLYGPVSHVPASIYNHRLCERIALNWLPEVSTNATGTRPDAPGVLSKQLGLARCEASLNELQLSRVNSHGKGLT